VREEKRYRESGSRRKKTSRRTHPQSLEVWKQVEEKIEGKE
jgi:hypothetical protein